MSQFNVKQFQQVKVAQVKLVYPIDKFEIWDTAGQEKYRSLAKVFYKNASACILVYDITKKDTFQELKNFWINEVINNGPKNMSK